MEFNLNALYTKYGPMVYRRCKYLLKDEDMAFDATQDVFMKIFEKKNSIRLDYPSSLLYTIATNLCLNIIRDNRKEFNMENDTVLSNIASYDDHENKFILNEIINSLFKRELNGTKEIAVMHHIDGMTYEEISNETGMSVSGIRKRLRKLKENLQLNHADVQRELL
ncbi:MAG: sigma-70 family RNA polymerase sigma factor [Spirochaetes bacterium]|nr:sigma-70 family RNA polymerase sigma factor [Spirochaetota bacterium]